MFLSSEGLRFFFFARGRRDFSALLLRLGTILTVLIPNPPSLVQPLHSDGELAL